MPIDLNDAPDQREFGAPLPDGTFVWLVGHIKRGGATMAGDAGPDIGIYKPGKTEGVLMLDWEFTVDAGPHKGRKVFQNMVITGGSVDESGHSKAGTISRGQLKAMVNSGTGLDPKDDSAAARAGRVIPSMTALDGIPFAARLGIEQSEGYADKNIIAHVVEPGEPEYLDIKAGKEVEPRPSGIRKHRVAGAAGNGVAAPAQNPSWMAAAAPAPTAQPAMPQPRWGAPAPAASPAPTPAPEAVTPASGPSWLRTAS
jgi:hypothetical protein